MDFSWEEILKLKLDRPELFKANQLINRDEGAVKNRSKALESCKKDYPGWKYATFKRAEMFLPDNWPAYYNKAKGCKVWDMDGEEYTDMSIMGVGTNIPGYGHPEVDEAVFKVVEQGNMSTLNCSEEVYLAERLIELHPWADMVCLPELVGRPIL